MRGAMYPSLRLARKLHQVKLARLGADHPDTIRALEQVAELHLRHRRLRRRARHPPPAAGPGREATRSGSSRHARGARGRGRPAVAGPALRRGRSHVPARAGAAPRPVRRRQHHVRHRAADLRLAADQPPRLRRRRGPLPRGQGDPRPRRRPGGRVADRPAHGPGHAVLDPGPAAEGGAQVRPGHRRPGAGLRRRQPGSVPAGAHDARHRVDLLVRRARRPGPAARGARRAPLPPGGGRHREAARPARHAAADAAVVAGPAAPAPQAVGRGREALPPRHGDPERQRAAEGLAAHVGVVAVPAGLSGATARPPAPGAAGAGEGARRLPLAVRRVHGVDDRPPDRRRRAASWATIARPGARSSGW